MADTPSIAGMALRTSEDLWDAGLHGEVDGAEVDIGLAIDGEAGTAQRVGVWIETQRLGRLALALDVSAEGQAQLASVAHARSLKGPLQPGAVPPSLAELERHQAEVAKLTGEVREAREAAQAQAQTAAEEKAKLEAALRSEAARYEEAQSKLALELENARADLARGQDERRRGQAELDAMQLELAKKGDPSPELLSGLEQAQAAHAATRKELEEAQDQLREARADLTRQGEALQAEVARAQKLEADLNTSRDGVAELERQAGESAATHAERTLALEQNASGLAERTAELQANAAALDERTAELVTAQGALEHAQAEASEVPELKGSIEALTTELKSEREAREREGGDHRAAKTELDRLKSGLANSAVERRRLEAELDQAKADAAAATGNGDAEVALSAEMEKSERLTRERDEARDVARDLKKNSARLLIERDEARALARTLHAKPGSSANSELQTLRAQLNEQRAVAKNLLEDKQLLETRLLGAQRQIELERKRHARVEAQGDPVTDELRVPSQLRSAADPSRSMTAPVSLDGARPTEPELPATNPKIPGPGSKKP